MSLPAKSSTLCLPPGAAVLPLPLDALAQFQRLMHGEGWPVDLARMCLDRDYAFECLAHAHTSSAEPLRRAAMALFAAYDRNAGAELMH